MLLPTLTFFVQANVKVGWEEKTFKANQLMQVNPPKMEKFEDVSNMTYLNEASVLWNLKSRYVCKLIYVSLSLENEMIAKPIPNKCFFCSDLLGPVLRCDQSIQTLSHLHGEDLPDLPWQEEERGAKIR